MYYKAINSFSDLKYITIYEESNIFIKRKRHEKLYDKQYRDPGGGRSARY